MGRKKGAQCTICNHKNRSQIEIGLTHGTSANVLGARFQVSHDAILRHAKNHLTPQMRAAILSAQKPSAIDLEALRTSETEGLLAQLVASRARLHQHGDLALQIGDIKGCVAVETAITANLTLVAKLLGQLVNHHSVSHTSLLISPDYLKLRAVLADALRPYPEAARAVGAALHRIESDAATDITNAARKAPIVIDAPKALPPPPC